jgi:hypothetical protein
MGAALANQKTGDDITASRAAFTVAAEDFQFIPVTAPIAGNGIKGRFTGSQSRTHITQSATENFADGAVKPADVGFGQLFR